MSTYQELENEFNKKVKNLQKICKHPFTEWLRESWAPGHSTGYEVFICQMCKKQINKRTLITLEYYLDKDLYNTSMTGLKEGMSEKSVPYVPL